MGRRAPAAPVFGGFLQPGPRSLGWPRHGAASPQTEG